VTAELEPPEQERERFRLPPFLDMGSLKLEDLEFDLEREVNRLRADVEFQAAIPGMTRRP